MEFDHYYDADVEDYAVVPDENDTVVFSAHEYQCLDESINDIDHIILRMLNDL